MDIIDFSKYIAEDIFNVTEDFEKTKFLPKTPLSIINTSKSNITPSTMESLNGEIKVKNVPFFQFIPVKNDTDDFRRSQLDWYSSICLENLKTFDCLDILDVFESVLIIYNYYKVKINSDNSFWQDIGILLQTVIDQLLNIEHGESILKLACTKNDKKINVTIFEELNSILMHNKEIVEIAVSLTVLVPTILLLNFAPAKKNTFFCRAGILRIYNVYKNKNIDISFPYNSIVKKLQDSFKLDDFVFQTKSHFIVSPFVYLTLLKRAKESNFIHDISIINGESIEFGITGNFWVTEKIINLSHPVI